MSTTGDAILVSMPVSRGNFDRQIAPAVNQQPVVQVVVGNAVVQASRCDAACQFVLRVFAVPNPDAQLSERFDADNVPAGSHGYRVGYGQEDLPIPGWATVALANLRIKCLP
ncbi:MAG: hypothetical protein R3D85_03945 [Paracoccaceae bacterium]